MYETYFLKGKEHIRHGIFRLVLDMGPSASLRAAEEGTFHLPMVHTSSHLFLCTALLGDQVHGRYAES